jgi:YebC/PmpR family DNA-binding regulatory protein
MSGHNKWSKIKHKKAATDAVKSRIFSKYSRLIAMESRRVMGDTSSPTLIAIVERAKKDSMPKDNIDRAIAKGKEVDGASLDEVMFEAFGPGGTAMLITAITDNNNRTAPEIKNIFSKHGYVVGSPGSAIWAFNKTKDGYSPITPTSLSNEDGESLANLIEKLEEQDDVSDIYTSADDIDI